MKKLIQWLAKVFNANIEVTKEVTKEVVKEVTKEIQVYIPENGVYDGDLYVKGDLCATGNIRAEGYITAFCNEGGGIVWQ